MRRTRPARRRRTDELRRGRPARAAGGPRAGRRRRSAAPRGTGRRRPAGTRRTASRAVRPVGRAGEDHPERLAATRGAGQLDEREVVTAGEDPDALGGDVPAADGAVDAVLERWRALARIHRPTVYFLPAVRAARRSDDARRYSQGYHVARRGQIPRPRRHDKEVARGTGRGSTRRPTRHRITSATPTRRTRRGSSDGSPGWKARSAASPG